MVTNLLLLCEKRDEMSNEMIEFTPEYIANCRKAKGGPWVFPDTREALDEIERLQSKLAIAKRAENDLDYLDMSVSKVYDHITHSRISKPFTIPEVVISVDELPEYINDDVYDAMFNCSHVDYVRLFPYIENNDEKYFLVLPEAPKGGEE